MNLSIAIADNINEFDLLFVLFIYFICLFHKIVITDDCLRSFSIFVSTDSQDPLMAMEKELCIFRHYPVPENGVWLTCENVKTGRYSL